MVEEEVEEELLVADEQRFLATAGREAGAELEQELLFVGDQRLLEVRSCAFSASLRKSNTYGSYVACRA